MLWHAIFLLIVHTPHNLLGRKEALLLSRHLLIKPRLLAATFNDNLGSSIVDDDIAKIFLDTYRQDLRSLLLAFQNREFGALDGALHRLKGALLAIQEDGLAQLSEQICHDSHRNPCVPTVIGLRKFVKNLLKVVRNLRTSLNANDLKNE